MMPVARLWDQQFATAAGRRMWPCEELVRYIGRRGCGTRQTGGLLGRVLEVGCGDGANLRCLAPHATQVIALDGSEKALALAWQASQSDTVFIRGDVRTIPLAASSVDLVVDCMVSQHVPWDEHRSLYEEYRRVLKPHGELFLYHLDNRTSGASTRESSAYDYKRLPLFPTVGLTCCPPPAALHCAVRWSGFADVERRGLAREYPDGLVAHYTVISGRRECE